MASGIRAEVKIDAPANSPIAQLSGVTNSSTHSISKSVNPDSPQRVTEEFMLETDADVDSAALDSPIDLETVFSYGSKTVYRFERPLGSGGPVECIERFDCPVIDLRTQSGSLFLAFHAPDMATLQAVIGELREQYPQLDVRRLLRSQQDRPEGSLIFVDRSTLTNRQREVLETAYRMGYFDHPKGANAGEVAAALDITASTLSEHLAAAQSKLLERILDV